MDFETCFLECCQACNCLDEEFKLPLEMREQDDPKGNFAIQDEQYIWMNTDKEKTIRSKVRKEDIPELMTENLTELQSSSCDCLKKLNKKQSFSDKSKYEAKEPESFNDCRNSSNFSYANWSSNYSVSDYHSKNDKLVDSVLELKEKVDLLFQILKNCGQKCSSEDCEKRVHTKSVQPIFGDFWHLLDFNRRLCAAEEGIKKLTLILEDHFKNFNKKRFNYLTYGSTLRDPLNFEEMSIGQRINLLKSRNDLLLDLMKKFFKVGSVEEIYSTLSLLPNNAEIKQAPELHFKEKTQENNLNEDDLIEALKNLKIQFTKIQENKPPSSVEQTKIMNEGRENAMKYFGNKLEVISERAELILNNENENTNLDDFKEKNDRNSQENFSEDNEESEKSLCEITSKLLAQEALLKSSLDKVHFGIFLNSADKKCMKGKQNINNIIITEAPVTGENQEGEIETNFNSSSSAKDECLFWETKNTTISKSNHTILSPEKCTHHKEFKESIKEEKSSSDRMLDNLHEQNSNVPIKKIHELREVKTKYSRKNFHKNTFAVLAPNSRSSKNDYCLPVRCSSSRGKTKVEDEVPDKRPVTAPNSLSKNVPSSRLKPPISQKHIKKNLGLNNVTNKNKISLSKKTFETS